LTAPRPAWAGRYVLGKAARLDLEGLSEENGLKLIIHDGGRVGECKWGASSVGRSVVRELVDKAPKYVPGEDWQVHYAFFARAGFTDAAQTEAKERGAILVDLAMLDQELRRALEAG
jgi:hypothetical protein